MDKIRMEMPVVLSPPSLENPNQGCDDFLPFSKLTASGLAHRPNDNLDRYNPNAKNHAN